MDSPLCSATASAVELGTGPCFVVVVAPVVERDLVREENSRDDDGTDDHEDHDGNGLDFFPGHLLPPLPETLAVGLDHHGALGHLDGLGLLLESLVNALLDELEEPLAFLLGTYADT